MEAQKSKGESAFNKLHSIRVPHILERIFFSLDYASFKKCKEVSRAWQELITSQSFKMIGKLTFREEIEKNLWHDLNGGKLSKVREVISSGMVNVDCTKDETKMTPLFFAAQAGFTDIVQALLKEGAEPNHQTLFFPNGWTPLHVAAAYGWYEVAKMLLDGGAFVNMEDYKNAIPLHYAQNQEFAKLLLDRGSHLNKESANGQTPLNFAVVMGIKNVVKYLLENGADPNTADNEGRTPLHRASYPGDLSCHKDIAQMLVDHGADLNAVCNSGHTPLSFALMRGKTEIANIIRENGGME